MRFPYTMAKAAEEADARLAEIPSMDRCQLGIELRATFAECKELKRNAWGRRSGPKFPSTFRPHDATEESVQAWLKAEKRAVDKTAKAKRRIEKKAQQASINDLDDRCSAILEFLRNSRGPQSIGQLVHGLERSKAFVGLSDKVRRNAIIRLVNPPKGRPSPLPGFIVLRTGTANNRKPTILVETRR